LIDFLNGYKAPIPLTVIALTTVIGVSGLTKARSKLPSHVQVKPGLWSLDEMKRWATRCDLCLLPSDPTDPIKNGASTNRLVTALALGLPTAADIIESYREFSEYFLDIRSPEFPDMIRKPLKFSQKVAEAQEKICPRFSAHPIASAWSDLLEQL